MQMITQNSTMKVFESSVVGALLGSGIKVVKIDI